MRVKAIIKTGMIMTEGIGIALTVLFGIFATGLVSIFTPLPEVIAAGATVLCTYMWSFLALGPQMLASTAIQAFGKAKASLLLSVARQGLFYIPLLLLLNGSFAFKGLLWAQPVADAITLVLGLILLVIILKRTCMGDTKADAIAQPHTPGIVITISREYGSGGREIGEKLASALAIPYYDKKLIDMAAKQSGLDSELIMSIEESVTKGVSYSAITGAYYAQSIFAYDGTPDSDEIFISQSKVISSLARQGSCIIVGRCADAVLHGKADTFDIFIKASNEERIRRVTEEYGVAHDDALSAINCADKVRANYYKHYTGKEWGAKANYDLILDSGTLGIDGCVGVLLKAIKREPCVACDLQA